MNNFKIGTRIIAGFAAVIFITIALAAFAYTEVSGIGKVADLIVTDNLPGIYMIGQVEILQNRKMALLFEHVQRTEKAEMSRIATKIDENTKQTTFQLDQYEQTITTPDDRALYDAIKSSRADFVSAQAEVLNASIRMSKKEAMALIDSRLKPSFLKFSETTVAETKLNKDHGDGSAKAITASVKGAKRGVLFGLLLAVAVAGWIAVFIGRGITIPLGRFIVHFGEIAKGDLSKDAPAEFQTRGDEIGILACAKQSMILALRKMILEISSGVKVLSSSSTALLTSSTEMMAGSRHASDKAHSVSTAAEEMSSNITSVAAGMEQTTVNLSHVASATEQMTSTIGEIAQNSEKARRITDEATRQAARITEQIDQLGLAAREIGKVTETITEISSQTNLLALNATIEAARAGAAGKGFAVVATEIKALAQQTAAATEDIKSRIAGVQAATAGGITEIGKISQVIVEVSAIVASIAAAIEEQASATKDIARNIAEASIGVNDANARVSETSLVSREIAKDIVIVDRAAGEMASGSDHVRSSADELSSVAEGLRLSVAFFHA